MHAFLEVLGSLNTGVFTFLILALLLALSFEFVNGFHDTANAVATVIYTNSLKPNVAVVWSGIWNLTGVLMSTGAVAYGIVALLPVELVLNIGSKAGFAMVFSLLISAMIWNVGTWYLGLPGSSSHSLIGAIMGVGIANGMLGGHAFGSGINWGKAQEVGRALIISPIVGFCFAALLLLLLKTVLKNNKELFAAPKKDAPPPLWIRAILILTCTGVSFAHGSNDGQKGQGLIVLILVGILPGTFALRLSTTTEDLQKISASAQAIAAHYYPKANAAGTDEKADARILSNFLKADGTWDDQSIAAFASLNLTVANQLGTIKSLEEIPNADRSAVRSNLYLVDETIGKLLKSKKITDPAQAERFKTYRKQLDGITKYIPNWVKFAVAIALGLGTIVGWKRIVVTVGEKIGKQHLSYAQGACAELVAMGTISAADRFGLPVSTTHVLSSGIAGTMAANGSGLQTETLRNILLAWVLTLPVCVFLGASLFAFAINVLLHGATQ